MRVARIPAPGRGIYPALKLHVDAGVIRIDLHRLNAAQVFRTTPALDCIGAVRQPHGLTIAAIDVRMERHVGSQPHRLWRIDVVESVFDGQRGDAAPAIRIEHSQRDGARRQAVEIEASTSELIDAVSNPGQGVKSESTATPAGIAAEYLNDAILNRDA
jgi:hypothetical protein